MIGKLLILLIIFGNVFNSYSQAHDGVSGINVVQNYQIYGSDLDKIKERINSDGFVRIIIDLKLEKYFSSLDSESKVMQRSAAIKAIQARVIERVFGGLSQAEQARGFSRSIRQYEITPSIAITVDGDEIRRLEMDPEVLRIHLDELSKPLLQNSVPLIGMSGDGGAYSLGATGMGQAVAVLDTGVQASHPFLSGKTIAEACFSNAAGSKVSLCPNGQKTQFGPGSAEATTPNCISGQEVLCSHGTHVSGIAVGNNPDPGIPPNGVAKDSKLIALQVFTRFNDSSSCGGAGNTPCVMSYSSDQIAALEWVYSNRNSFSGGVSLASVNMSLGGGVHSTACDDDPRKPAIDALRSMGVATTIASGNDGYVISVNAPGCISTAVTVGATTLSDDVAYFSNESQALVDLLSPGVDILSSVPVNVYEQMSGTSMATPHVAGTFAAIKSRLPLLTVDQIEGALKSTGLAVPNHLNTYTKPRIQVNSALNYLGVVSRRLTVSKTGSGTVTSVPAGIDCGSNCSASYADGTSVTLSQTAAEGYTFTGWGGACSGTGTCTVAMDSDKSVTATFTPKRILTVSRTGSGTVTSVPAGIDCGSNCSASYADGTSVTLSQTPAAGYAFTGWSGGCSGSGACVVAMDSDKSVVASFAELPKYPVIIKKPTTGLVVSDPAGIMCGGKNKQCVASFSYGTLTATPNPSYEFIKWIGCPSAQGSECTINPTSKMTIQAVFKKLPKYTLKVTKDKLGSVTSSPAGLKCPASKKTCSVKFDKGTEVTLSPVPQAGRTFAGWTGACSGFDPCVFQMDGNKGVGAMFQ